MKRIFDLFASVILGIAALPVILIAAVAVVVDSGMPAFFLQTRLGRNEKPFRLCKLRTMVSGTADMATHHVNRGSITSVGQFLRRSKLDELPQLWNVFLGQMSLVGPRPGLPMQLELTDARRRFSVFSVRPGITGLAQVRNIDMSDPELLARTDRDYIDSRSFRGDLMILLATVAGAGGGDAANQDS
jgi:O-antigen biosynthesis protein WbqP